MFLMIFLLGLPILLGYLLFVGLSGRFLPFPAPKNLTQRPQWLLALGTAAITALVVSLTAIAAHSLPLNQLDTLWLPSLSLFMVSLAINTCVYFWYRHTINQAIQNTASEQALSSDAQLAIHLAKINASESYAGNSAHRVPWEPSLYSDSTSQEEEMPLVRDRAAQPAEQSEAAYIDLTVSDYEETLVETLLFDQTIALNDIDADATVQLHKRVSRSNAKLNEQHFSDTQLEF